MADVFISYSRHNITFARRLFDALQEDGRDSWIDWDDIPISAEWFKAIQEGIEGANGFVFVMTPDSLASPVCALEVEHAISSHKRIIPLVYVESNIADAYGKLAAITPTGFLADMLAGRDLLEIARKNWSVLERINWIFFREVDDFDTGLVKLINVVETDYERVKLHTRLLVRATEWRDKNFDSSYLLVGTDLRDAASWLKVAGDKPPMASEAHKVFIRASLHQEEEENAKREQQIAALNDASKRAADESVRAAAQARRARIATLIAALLVLALVAAALVAGTQVSDANTRITTATVAQGLAQFDQASATVAQGLAVQRADSADTQVAVAGASLTPLPPTLTQANVFRQNAVDSQQILQELSDVLLLLDAGVYVDAEARMQRLVAAFPDNPIAYRAHGTVQFRQGDAEGAVQSYTSSIELDPTYSEGYLSRGYAYASLGKNDKAIDDFTEVLALEPTNEVAYYNRGTIYTRMGQYQTAIGDYDEAIALNPNYTEAYNNRGLTYAAVGEDALAAADFRRALSLDPTSASICASLNAALAELGLPRDPCAGTDTPTPTPSATLKRGVVVPPTQRPVIAPTASPLPFETDLSPLYPATSIAPFYTLTPGSG